MLKNLSDFLRPFSPSTLSFSINNSTKFWENSADDYLISALITFSEEKGFESLMKDIYRRRQFYFYRNVIPALSTMVMYRSE